MGGGTGKQCECDRSTPNDKREKETYIAGNQLLLNNTRKLPMLIQSAAGEVLERAHPTLIREAAEPNCSRCFGIEQKTIEGDGGIERGEIELVGLPRDYRTAAGRRNDSALRNWEKAVQCVVKGGEDEGAVAV